MKKFLKYILIIFVILLGFVGNYFFNLALNPNVKKEFILNQDKVKIEDEYEKKASIWFDENSKNIELETSYGLQKGYLFENNSDKLVIVVHGYANNARKMARYIKRFYDKGYDVLAVDLIAHGNSEGKYYSMGGFDSKVLSMWINTIPRDKKIALFGISMGASTVMNTLDEKLDDNVVLAIEDSGYVNLKSIFSYQLKKLFNLPSFPILDVASIISRVRAGYWLNNVDATNAIKETKIPVLAMHGTNDSFVPMDNLELIRNLNPKIKTIEFEGMKHVAAEKLQREKYWSEVFKFIEENMK